MTIVLDGLIIAIPIMLALLGIGRGIQREAMTLIGILFGALLAEIGAREWAPARASQFNQDLNHTTVFLAVALLLTSTILIGYGGAFLLPARQQLAKGRSRWFGGIAGAINGVLLVSLLLRYASWRENEPSMLMQSRWSGLLAPKFSTLLLISLCVAITVVLVRLIQRLILVIHKKPPAAPSKPAVKPTQPAKPAEPPKVVPAKPASSASANNDILRDLLKAEEQKVVK